MFEQKIRYAIRNGVPTKEVVSYLNGEIVSIDNPLYVYEGNPIPPEPTEDDEMMQAVLEAGLIDSLEPPVLDPYALPLQEGVTLYGTDGFDGESEWMVAWQEYTQTMNPEPAPSQPDGRLELAQWMVGAGAPLDAVQRFLGVILDSE